MGKGELTGQEVLDRAVATELLALRREIARMNIEMNHVPTSAALDLILTTVCERFQKDPVYVCSKSRREEHLTPRQVYCWLARKLTVASYYEISRG